MNIERFFLFVADIVFRARCVACVSDVEIELQFGSDGGYVQFPVLADTPTPISLLEPSVCMSSPPLYLFSTTF